MPPNENLYASLSVSDLVALAYKRSGELGYESRSEREGAWKVHPDIIKDSMLLKRLADVLKEMTREIQDLKLPPR